MARQTIELLIRIESLQQDRDLLLDPARIDGHAELGEALLELGLRAGANLGCAAADRGDVAGERSAALLDVVPQALAFAQAGGAELIERVLQQLVCGIEQGLIAAFT